MNKKNISLRDAFGNALIELAERRDDFVVLDADVAGGTGCLLYTSPSPRDQ